MTLPLVKSEVAGVASRSVAAVAFDRFYCREITSELLDEVAAVVSRGLSKEWPGVRFAVGTVEDPSNPGTVKIDASPIPLPPGFEDEVVLAPPGS